MKIRIADSKIGECVITSKKDLTKQAEYTIKALCMLQITCMNSKENPEKFIELLAILKEATDKATRLYCEKNDTESITLL